MENSQKRLNELEQSLVNQSIGDNSVHLKMRDEIDDKISKILDSS